MEKISKKAVVAHWGTQGGRRLPGCSPPCPNEIKKKHTDFVDPMISKVLRDLRFSLHQPLKSADNWYIGMLKNIIKT